MRRQIKTTISRLFFLSMAAISVISIVVTGYLLITRDYRQMTDEMEHLREDYVNEQKQMIKNEVEKAINLITYQHSLAEGRLKANIKARTNEAISIAQNLYDQHHASIGPDKMRKLIFDALRPIRFNEGRGYYFATDFNGIELLFADRPEMEGKNLLSMRDANGAFVIQDMIELVKSEGEGYYRYVWSKPERKEMNFPKIAYIKRFDPIGGFIGTGEYLDDMERDIQREVLNQIGNIRFGKDGYIFIVNYQGVTLMNGVQPQLIGKDMWEMTDPYGVKVIQEERRAVDNPNGDFINYHWEKPTTGKISPKVTFLKGYPAWEWMVGAGVYADEVESEIEKLETGYRAEAHKTMFIMGLLLVSILCGILLLSFFFSRYFSREFNVLLSFIKRMETGGEPIDTGKLSVQELINLAESANTMLATRRQAEQELHERTVEFERYFSTALDLFCIADTDGYFRRLNQQWEKTLGYSLQDLEGKRFFDFIHSDDIASTAQTVSQLADQKPVQSFVNRYRCKDGSYRWLEWRAYPNEDVIFAAAHDITDRIKAEAEKERLEAQLHQAMKMEAVGRLAGGIAHDFNNLLTGITGNVSLAMLDLEPDDPLASIMVEIDKAAMSAAALTRQLLAFSRKQIIEPKVVNLNELISSLHKMLVRLIGEDIELKTTPGNQLGSVKIDPGQFEQIIINLAINARDAMPDGGKLVIETAPVELDEEYCLRHPDAAPGNYVMLAVSDTGHGMSKEIMSHLFEPFFTTKPKGHGTGLGLATIYGAVKQASGTIEVYSEPDLGTTFKIYLPRLEVPAEKVSLGRDSRQMPGGSETVLVVEDEATVRNLAIKILKRLGYRVLHAPNGAEALVIAEKIKDRIDLLMTDVVMPGMNGRQLAEQLVAFHPESKVLYTSGYTENVIAHHGVVEEGLNFIGKPYTPPALAKKIRDVLDSK